jgi:glucuronate isomerase
MSNQLDEQIFNNLMDLPLLDAHTHVDAAHLTARGLHDVLLYHMVISELYSSGCPDGDRLSEEPSEAEVEYRMERALPYVKYIRNTSCFWGVRMILKDLYGWDKPITEENWREIHEIIRKKSQSPAWHAEIMKKGKIEKLCTELWRRKDGSADDILTFSLEWAFFGRCQWNQYDTALLELENTWDKTEVGTPLPVTIGEGEVKIAKRIRIIEDVHEAIKHYCDLIPFNEIVNVAQWLSTDIQQTNFTVEEMKSALLKRDTAGPAERDIYAGYIFEYFLTELEKRNERTALNVGIGAEPLPFETGSKLKTDTIFEIASIAQRHPNIDFHIFSASAQHNQAFCSLVRELPNLYMSGYWWHSFFPGFIGRTIEERLDMIPLKKQIGFFSDAYCLDWSYAKSIIVRKQLAEVLEKKVNMGQYSIEEALVIARILLYETTEECLGMLRKGK